MSSTAAIENAMSEELKTHLAYSEHDRRIEAHYAHAREKHPYLCDAITYHTAHTGVPLMLRRAREQLRFEIDNQSATARDVLDCEVWEAINAFVHGDTAAAVEEIYDAIAVLLRTIDVLEGRQKLGKPEEESKGDDRLDSPECLLDFLETLPECEDFIFQDAKGYWTITNEWLCGTIAGRGFRAATKGEAAKQLIDYLNEHVNHQSIVGYAVTNSGWPNKGQVLNYIGKTGEGEGK